MNKREQAIAAQLKTADATWTCGIDPHIDWTESIRFLLAQIETLRQENVRLTVELSDVRKEGI